MIQILLYVLQLVVLALLSTTSFVFIILAVIKRKDKQQLTLYLSISITCIIATVTISLVDLFAAESEDRETTVDAFESNFGFKPPESVDEIKVKDFGIYDSDAHWMAFTYDSTVVQKILVHDQPLDTVDNDAPKFNEIVKELEQGCNNCPDWIELPNNNVTRIYYKKDFLQHTYSDYYLWVDTKRRMVYLQVSYFD